MIIARLFLVDCRHVVSHLIYAGQREASILGPRRLRVEII